MPEKCTVADMHEDAFWLCHKVFDTVVQRRVFINKGSPEECLNMCEHSNQGSMHTIVPIACWNAAAPEAASLESCLKGWLQTCE